MPEILRMADIVHEPACCASPRRKRASHPDMLLGWPLAAHRRGVAGSRIHGRDRPAPAAVGLNAEDGGSGGEPELVSHVGELQVGSRRHWYIEAGRTRRQMHGDGDRFAVEQQEVGAKVGVRVAGRGDREEQLLARTKLPFPAAHDILTERAGITLVEGARPRQRLTGHPQAPRSRRRSQPAMQIRELPNLPRRKIELTRGDDRAGVPGTDLQQHRPGLGGRVMEGE